MDQLPYTETEYQAFGPWTILAQSSLPMADTHGLDFDSARECTPRWYGVSSGDGNDGVSHMYPDYYVRTNDPWRLAKLALVSSFNDSKTREWARDEADVDGEADYTLAATLYEGPDGETAYGAAWLIYEVFPAEVEPGDDEPRGTANCYESLEDAFSAAQLSLVPKED